MCTPYRAKVVTGALALTALIIYFPIIWTVSIFKKDNKDMCMPLLSMAPLMTALVYMDLAVAFLIPVAMIVVINITVSHRIVQFIRHKEKQLVMEDKTQDEKLSYRKMKKQISITRYVETDHIYTRVETYIGLAYQ